MFVLFLSQGKLNLFIHQEKGARREIGREIKNVRKRRAILQKLEN